MTESEMRELFALHHKDLMRYAVRRVGRSDAPDIVSEAFAIAFDHRIRPDTPLPWLYGIARNVIRNHVRTEARTFALVPDVGVDIGDGVVERESVLAALRALPEISREAIMLTAWEGLEPEVAAVVMGCSHATFRVRLHRARKQLTTALATPLPMEGAAT
jgi:RNA polymerase sigma-70 factor, ECF subfamily